VWLRVWVWCGYVGVCDARWSQVSGAAHATALLRAAGCLRVRAAAKSRRTRSCDCILAPGSLPAPARSRSPVPSPGCDCRSRHVRLCPAACLRRDVGGHVLRLGPLHPPLPQVGALCGGGGRRLQVRVLTAWHSAAHAARSAPCVPALVCFQVSALIARRPELPGCFMPCPLAHRPACLVAACPVPDPPMCRPPSSAHCVAASQPPLTTPAFLPTAASPCWARRSSSCERTPRSTPPATCCCAPTLPACRSPPARVRALLQPPRLVPHLCTCTGCPLGFCRWGQGAIVTVVSLVASIKCWRRLAGTAKAGPQPLPACSGRGARGRRHPLLAQPASRSGGDIARAAPRRRLCRLYLPQLCRPAGAAGGR
jgi:hypothetical protein